MTAHAAPFARTTSWLFKAYNLALIISASDNSTPQMAVLNGLCFGLGALLLVCALPSVVHPMRSRAATNALVLQTVLMITAMQLGLCMLGAYGHRSTANLWVQLLSGHIAYSVTTAALADKSLLIGAPFVALAFGTATAVIPVAASFCGPRAPEAHGLLLIAALGAGEVCGLCVFCVSYVLRLAGQAYEGLVRVICE